MIYPRQEARAIARRVAEHYLGKPYHLLLLDSATQISESTISKINAALDRLLRYEPLQYVLGESEFCGLTLRVTPAVLIPRPETEQLAMALQKLYRGHAMHAMDMCTGSGAIAIALASALPKSKVAACDVSEAALEVASENAARCGVEVEFRRQDILSEEAFWPINAWDLLVSNPPYVPESRASELSPNVTRYEPRGALYVPTEDPLIFYRTILQRGEKSLREGGMMAFEIDSDYADSLLRLAHGLGYATAAIANDLSGKPRFLLVAREAGNACVGVCKAILEEV